MQERFSTDPEKPLLYNPLVVHYGGGTNSTALLVGLAERGIIPTAILFSDTMGEKPRTYKFIRESLDPWLTAHKFPPVVCVRYSKSEDESLEAEVLRREALPAIVYGRRTCSEKWKIRPQQAYIRKYLKKSKTDPAVVGAIGFDYGELGRAKPSPSNGLEFFWYPLIGWKWGRKECEAAIQRAGLPQPGKSACFYCPSSRKPEVLQLAKENPELFKRAVEMERKALASGKLRKIDGLGRHWSWEKLVQLADRSPKLFQELPEAPEIACMCFDGD